MTKDPSIPDQCFGLPMRSNYMSREGPDGLSFRIINDCKRMLYVKVWTIDDPAAPTPNREEDEHEGSTCD